MNETEEILVTVAEAHASADTAFKIRSGAGHIKGNHALILVPDVYHAVYLFVGRINVILTEKAVPVHLEFSEKLIRLFGGVALFDHLMSALLVDYIFLGICGSDELILGSEVGCELFVNRVFNITEYENEILAFARFKVDLDIMGSDRRPAISNGVRGSSLHNRLRLAEAVIQTEEALAVGIKAVYLRVYGIECEMVAAFLIFGLVVNCAAFDLNFARVEVSLEVCGVVVCVPETPFEEAEQLYFLKSICLIGYCNLLNLAVKILGNKECYLSFNALGFALYNGVAHTVTAFVAVKFGLYGRPAGVPHMTAVIDIEITSAHVHGNIVVAIAGNAAKSCVLVEAVAACRVGNQREEALSSEVVDPRIGSAGRSNDVFLICVIKIAKFHIDTCPSLF